MSVVYYAGPLFTDAERLWNSRNVDALRASVPEAQFLVPQEFCAVHDTAVDGEAKPDFTAIFADCVQHLDEADVVLAILDGADPDSGTAWEVGYAYARGKKVIGWRTDWRPGEDGTCNCMLSQGCVALCKTFGDVLTALREHAV